MSDERDSLIRMGFAEAEVDQFLAECAADSAAFDAWWGTLSKQEQASIRQEIQDLREQTEGLPLDFPEMTTERIVYQRHGFTFQYGSPCPKLSESQKVRYIELIASDTTMMEHPRVIPFKGKP